MTLKNPQKIDEIRGLMQGYIDDRKLAGIVAVICHDGDTVMMEPFGVQDLETKVPVSVDSLFRIYSMTKPITSVALMTLYEEGKFGLDDPLARHLPSFEQTEVYSHTKDDGEIVTEPCSQPLTIRHLMTHTAGLSYGWRPDAPVDGLYRKYAVNAPDVDIEEMTRRIGRMPLVCQPGTQWQYSLAVDVQGHLIEALSDQKFDAFLKQRIFEPLGMADTGFSVPEDKRDRFTSNYSPAGGMGVEIIRTKSANDSGPIERIDRPGESTYDQNPKLLSGGGGLVSSAPDYLAFAMMLRNKGELNGTRILKAETVDLMTKNHILEELVPIGLEGLYLKGTGFGLGFSVRVEASDQKLPGSKGDYGWGGAASTDVFISPEDDLVGIFLTQFMPKFYYPIETEFKRLALQAVKG